ncbi:hypothetical protein NDU88_000590 [Pleurodeles waltl]|uniref:Uncharacterized protein n=1 Tax=Pleurodeles waltl TaxID=8319 RepID=A0AAV7VYM7_PLEWA|nr:hypothetical protein NDU88_000590 [Pleurodeles waltl]
MRETVLAEVAQRSPTSPETNLESRAMQVRVPWTQAWLCTKDFCRKCTGAGVAAKSRVSQQRSPARFAGFQRGQQLIPYQKVKREMQRNSAELMHSLSKVSPETETLNSQKRGFGYLGERIGY